MYGKREISGLYGNIGPALSDFFRTELEMSAWTVPKRTSRNPRSEFDEEMHALPNQRTNVTKRLKLDGMCRRLRRSVDRTELTHPG